MQEGADVDGLQEPAQSGRTAQSLGGPIDPKGHTGTRSSSDRPLCCQRFTLRKRVTIGAQKCSDRKSEASREQPPGLLDLHTSRAGSRQTRRDRLYAPASVRQQRVQLNHGKRCAYTRDRPAPGRVLLMHQRSMRCFRPLIARSPVRCF